MENTYQHTHTMYNLADISKVLPWQPQDPRSEIWILLRAEEQTMAYTLHVLAVPTGKLLQ